MDFARQRNFRQPFSKVYFTDEKSIQHFFDSDRLNKIPRHVIFNFENYESRFEEILSQGYSWLNINFVGMIENSLFIFIETPNNESNILQKSASVNVSLPVKKFRKMIGMQHLFIKL